MILKPIFSTLPTGDLVLASASATRVKLLEDAGLGFCQYPVSIDEEAIRAAAIAEAIPAQDIAVTLAEMKAAVAVQRLDAEHLVPPTFVVGCDQILICDDIIYNKPEDTVAAKSQLSALSGKTHQLLTAVVLFQFGKRIWHHLSVADMTMRQFDNDFIDFYLEQLGVAAFFSPGASHPSGPPVQPVTKAFESSNRRGLTPMKVAPSRCHLFVFPHRGSRGNGHRSG